MPFQYKHAPSAGSHSLFSLTDIFPHPPLQADSLLFIYIYADERQANPTSQVIVKKGRKAPTAKLGIKEDSS